ncbi:hypothetical protein [Desulfofalx alkaliphila]|uniref:hypothetical protein n=1 Tax=Desulfofalx alkaliphila TaxID=105483 RepID=UPI0004E1AED6|nr:hypothetical protein [Desulfofalx alkaliphila]
MALDKIFDEIKKLSPAERYKLRVMLELDEITEEDIELSKQAAGSWDDIDADQLIKDIYEKRLKNSRPQGVKW